MNKIQRAIHDTRAQLEDKIRKRMCLMAEIQALEDVIERLEAIESSESIPHMEGTLALDHDAVTAFKFTPTASIKDWV
jgi:hypothetical protein